VDDIVIKTHAIFGQYILKLCI